MGLSRKPELPHTIKTRIILIFTILVILPFIILSIIAFSMFSRYAIHSILEATKDTVSMVSYQIHSSTKEYEELTMLASGVANQNMSGVKDQFLSGNCEPIYTYI